MEIYVLKIPVETGNRIDAEDIENSNYGSLAELKESEEFRRLGAGVKVIMMCDFTTDWNDSDEYDDYSQVGNYWLSYVTIG